MPPPGGANHQQDGKGLRRVAGVSCGGDDWAKQVVAANGLGPNAFTYITNYQGRADQMAVKAVQAVPTAFMRVLGIETTSAFAHAAARSGPPRAFDYALFSGSQTQTLQLNGNNEVEGGTHGNANIQIGSNNHMEAVEQSHRPGNQPAAFPSHTAD